MNFGKAVNMRICMRISYMMSLYVNDIGTSSRISYQKSAVFLEIMLVKNCRVLTQNHIPYDIPAFLGISCKISYGISHMQGISHVLEDISKHIPKYFQVRISYRISYRISLFERLDVICDIHNTCTGMSHGIS